MIMPNIKHSGANLSPQMDIWCEQIIAFIIFLRTNVRTVHDGIISQHYEEQPERTITTQQSCADVCLVKLWQWQVILLFMNGVITSNVCRYIYVESMPFYINNVDFTNKTKPTKVKCRSILFTYWHERSEQQ